jgi:hypothetical protein
MHENLNCAKNSNSENKEHHTHFHNFEILHNLMNNKGAQTFDSSALPTNQQQQSAHKSNFFAGNNLLHIKTRT